MPDAPVLVAGVSEAVWLGADGDIERLTCRRVRRRLDDSERPPILCHLPDTARRLNRSRFPALDILELFAFVHPARFCVPTPRGLAAIAGLDPPEDLADQAWALREATLTLLAQLARSDYPDAETARRFARIMTGQNWAWGGPVLRALGAGAAPGTDPLDPWRGLPEWQDRAPPPPPGQRPVPAPEVRTRLAEILGPDAETRPQQADYASAAAHAFAARAEPDQPQAVLAEAGTGVGKTLGYVAPASLWTQLNGGTVWLSTYTKNLQRQIDHELDRVYPDPARKANRVVVRKGRENYLCLLNFEDAARQTGGAQLPGPPGAAVALGLMARWITASRDGALIGGDFPTWLAGLLGRPRTLGLADHRGECIYSACPHYRRCFIERANRLARHADMVIANHALVMIHAARDDDEARPPGRYVFDEGHHLFDAADSAFSAYLSGLETRELRRWLRGQDGAGQRTTSRLRGLRRRIEGLIDTDQAALATLDAIFTAARALPDLEWGERVRGDAPRGPAERFLAAIYRQVRARADNAARYSLEADARPPNDDVLPAADALDRALAALAQPMADLEVILVKRLDDEAAALDSTTRVRLEALARSLRRRRAEMIAPWRAMLQQLAGPPPEAHVDWFSIRRSEGRDIDVGMHRHWVDPTIPFAEAVLRPAHGVLITSATLRDGSGDIEADWQAAERRTGLVHLAGDDSGGTHMRAAMSSPFDYAAQTRVLIVTDVDRGNADLVAAAYRELFMAAGGGALGLFTAISRLRAAYDRLAPHFEQAGLPLYAQHVDALDPATLIDIFRAESDANLLGTDALRDGIDVPGRSLRLIVFDRVPWPRPDILHRARRAHFGGRRYDDMLTRYRIKQAFGRLIRREQDRGVFVMLDPGTPSRLYGAFPDGASPRRVGLAEAVADVRSFLGETADQPPWQH